MQNVKQVTDPVLHQHRGRALEHVDGFRHLPKLWDAGPGKNGNDGSNQNESSMPTLQISTEKYMHRCESEVKLWGPHGSDTESVSQLGAFVCQRPEAQAARGQDVPSLAGLSTITPSNQTSAEQANPTSLST